MAGVPPNGPGSLSPIKEADRSIDPAEGSPDWCRHGTESCTCADAHDAKRRAFWPTFRPAGIAGSPFVAIAAPARLDPASRRLCPRGADAPRRRSGATSPTMPETFPLRLRCLPMRDRCGARDKGRGRRLERCVRLAMSAPQSRAKSDRRRRAAPMARRAPRASSVSRRPETLLARRSQADIRAAAHDISGRFPCASSTLYLLLWLAALAGPLSRSRPLPVQAHEYKVGDTCRWATPGRVPRRRAPRSAAATSRYRNTGTKPDRLIGGSFEAAERLGIGEMSVRDGVDDHAGRSRLGWRSRARRQTVELKPWLSPQFVDLKATRSEEGDKANSTLTLRARRRGGVDSSVCPSGRRVGFPGPEGHMHEMPKTN